MNTFNETLYKVLNSNRYDRLTGRSADLRKVLTDAAERAIRFILERFNFNLPDFSNYDTDWFLYIFVVVSAALLLTAAAFIIRFILRRRRFAASGETLSDIFEELAQNNYSAEDLLSLSDDRVKLGHIREAVRFRYMAVLVKLNEIRAVTIERHKTNGQLLSELSSAAPAYSSAFAKTVEIFHYVWFGNKPVTGERYALFQQDTDVLFAKINSDRSIT